MVYVVGTASALTVALFADIALTVRRIFAKLDNHAERIAVLETKCTERHREYDLAES